MRRLVLLLPVLLLVASCGSDDEESAGPSSIIIEPGTTTQTRDTPAATSSVAASFSASTDDPVYVALILDCVYGENEADSCGQLEEAGLAEDDAYGLGNSLTQASAQGLRADCFDGDAFSCAELDRRVTAVELGAEDLGHELLCTLAVPVIDGTATGDVDIVRLRRLLGADAPPGVLDGIDRLGVAPDDGDALDPVAAYLGPICAR